MDKAARFSIPEIGTPVSECELSCYLPLLSTPFRNRKHNPSVSLFCSSPSGENSPCFIFFPLSLPSFSSSHSLPPFFSLFLTLKDPTFSVSLRSHTTDEMTHGRKDREAFCCMAWNWIPMTSSARCNTSHSSTVVKGWRSITLDGFTQWLLSPVVIKQNHCFITLPD